MPHDSPWWISCGNIRLISGWIMDENWRNFPKHPKLRWKGVIFIQFLITFWFLGSLIFVQFSSTHFRTGHNTQKWSVLSLDTIWNYFPHSYSIFMYISKFWMNRNLIMWYSNKSISYIYWFHPGLLTPGASSSVSGFGDPGISCFIIVTSFTKQWLLHAAWGPDAMIRRPWCLVYTIFYSVEYRIWNELICIIENK